MAPLLLSLLGIHLAIGLLFGIAFVIAGAKRIDPGAREGTWGFRLLILPGAAALWPLMMQRWLRGSSDPPTESNAHRDAASSKPTADS